MTKRKREPVGTAVLMAVSAVIVTADRVIRVLTGQRKCGRCDRPICPQCLLGCACFTHGPGCKAAGQQPPAVRGTAT